MAKNILILTGSPRRGGNSNLLADEFIAGTQQSGHTTVKYATAEKILRGVKLVILVSVRESLVLFQTISMSWRHFWSKLIWLCLQQPCIGFHFQHSSKLPLTSSILFSLGKEY